jgi:hypothetical protein
MRKIHMTTEDMANVWTLLWDISRALEKYGNALLNENVDDLGAFSLAYIGNELLAASRLLDKSADVLETGSRV